MISFRLGNRLLLAVVVIVAALSPVVSKGAPDHLPLPSPAALDTLLNATTNPARNLIAVTQRLKLHSTVPINPVVNAQRVNYPVGSTATFFVANGNSQNGYTLRQARLVLKTAHLYFYIDHDFPVDIPALRRSAATFEQHIYPTDHAAFGQEWTPGVDNDLHITIYNGTLADALGYFSAEDLFPRSVNSFSNQRKMIYMNLSMLEPGTSAYDAVLAHEFQHMIHYHMHPADDAWINEGSSMLAQVLNGYDASGFDGDKARAPNTQLDTWSVTNFAPYYGGGYLWLLYLYEHFGGAHAIRTVLQDRQYSSMALFSDVLARLGTHLTVNELFARWVVANFLNDRSLYGGIYGYTHTAVRSLPTATEPLLFTRTALLPQYSADYLDIPRTNGAAFTVHFSGAPTVPLINTVTPTEGFWWSNRGDNVDDTLTLPVLDLRRTAHATLRYQLWYDLEQDYDYGYVEVSTDGGKTWYSQRTTHTTHSNPNGANLGDGYTGSSCSHASLAQHCWVSESIDLSAYAGKQILVRFEQITDDEYNLQGIAVAHVQVPALGFSSDTPIAGWQAAGWIRAANTLSERWIVQALVFRAGTVHVVSLPVNSEGQGDLHIAAGSSRVTVIVSPAAPETTTPSRYTLRTTR